MLRSELTYFRKALRPIARRLFFSNLSQCLASALTQVFVAAFIWGQTSALVSVAIYQLGQYALQPYMFGLNGLILRHIQIRRMFLFGATLAGLSTLAVLFISSETPLLGIFVLGCVRAVGQGFYWPNRNVLEFRGISDQTRNYYFGLIHATGWVVNTVAPVVTGSFIAFGRMTGRYPPALAYWVVFAASVVLMVASGVIMAREAHNLVVGERIIMPKRRLWSERRLLGLAQGVVNSAAALSPVTVLLFLGSEGVLGTLAAVAALSAAGGAYLFGRMSGNSNRYRVASVSSIAHLGASIALIVLPAPFNAVTYVLWGGIASEFFYVGAEPIILARAEEDMRGDQRGRYGVIVDNEWFLNTGRALGIAVFIGLASVWSERAALLAGPFVVGTTQLGLLGIVLMERNRRLAGSKHGPGHQ